MRTVGIIAEYDPFHNGHEYQIRKLKEQYDSVVCVLGAEFGQRGCPSMFTRGARTRMCLECGADIVVELPVEYSCSNAKDFAFGGISLLDSIGIVDDFSFGAKCDDINILNTIVEYISSDECNVSKLMKNGIGYAKAVQLSVEEKFGSEYSECLSDANNVLGIEYLLSAKSINSKMGCTPIKRYSVNHNEKFNDSFASGSYIRENIISGNDVNVFLPESTSRIIEEEIENKNIIDIEKFNYSLLTVLRMLSLEQIKETPGVSEGLENRVFNAISSCSSIDEIVDYCVNKRYTAARIRRILIAAALGFKKRPNNIEYIKIIGLSNHGKEMLSLAKTSLKLPMVSTYSQIKSLGENAGNSYDIECKASDFYGLCLKKIRKRGAVQTMKLICPQD